MFTLLLNMVTRFRKSKLFAVTVPYVTQTKRFVFDLLSDYCDRLVITEEKHFNIDQVHHHIYMRTIDKFFVSDIKNMIRIIYTGGILNEEDDQDDSDQDGDNIDPVSNSVRGLKIHVTRVKSERNYLKYITKQDRSPLSKGILDTEFSMYYNAMKWATQVHKFKYSDPFVLSHPQWSNLLANVHREIQESRQEANKKQMQPFDMELYRLVNPFLRNVSPNVPNQSVVNQTSNAFNNQLGLSEWQQRVVDWWNDWVTQPIQHKKPQLYLSGPPNCGKTTFIHHLLTSCLRNTNTIDENAAMDQDEYSYETQIFRPTPNEFKYAWQDYDSDRHTLVVIDEFNIQEYNLNDFKKAIAGEQLTTNCKGSSAKCFRLRMPMIFISNHRLEQRVCETKYPGLLERLHVVNI